MPDRGEPTRGKPSASLTEVIGRALTDEKFRAALTDNPKAAAAEYDLTEADQEALASIPQETLAEHANKFRSGSAEALEIKVVIRVKF